MNLWSAIMRFFFCLSLETRRVRHILFDFLTFVACPKIIGFLFHTFVKTKRKRCSNLTRMSVYLHRNYPLFFERRERAFLLFPVSYKFYREDRDWFTTPLFLLFYFSKCGVLRLILHPNGQWAASKGKVFLFLGKRRSSFGSYFVYVALIASFSAKGVSKWLVNCCPLPTILPLSLSLFLWLWNINIFRNKSFENSRFLLISD